MGALATMTVLSAALGWAAPALIPAAWTHRAAVALFLVFGVRSLYEAATGGGESAAAEMEEVERELEELHTGRPGGGAQGAASTAGGGGRATGAPSPKQPLAARAAAAASRALPAVLVEAFTLTFLAEWGDRSQIATIGLASTADPVGVTLGGIVGHAVCTGAAVLGGRHLATHINERTVHAVGGLLFLAFGVHAAVTGPGA
jgi:putative Ca2+/H+ antiporter (TMEM165/GDT1 family)